MHIPTPCVGEGRTFLATDRMHSAAIAPGCQRAPYACVKVSGKVTYEDGSLIPADRIHVVFLSQTPPIDAKTPPKAGTADADGKTGTFDFATTFIYKDGIIPGEHKVFIQCFRNGQSFPGLVADEYSNPARSPLKVKSSESPFDLKVRKPEQSTSAGGPIP